MMDVEELREALHDHPVGPRPALDSRQIMAAGGRMRRRRRIRTAALSAAALSLVLAAGIFLGSSGKPVEISVAGPPPPLPPTVGPMPVPAETAAPTTAASPPTTPTVSPQESPPPTAAAVGAVIPARSQNLPGQVLYMTGGAGSTSPVPTSLMSGRRQAGTLTVDVSLSATSATDRHAGFQGFHPATGDRPGLSFGYYRGAVRSVAAVDARGGIVASARRVTWSRDPDVVIFWFTPEDLAAGPVASQLRVTKGDGSLATIVWSDLGTVAQAEP